MNEENLSLGLSFDDVLLAPNYSSVLPKDTDISAYLTPKIKLNIPLVSAAMDTVTESKMAIAMALAGGIGVIHKNLSIEDQAKEVEIVKRFENGFIRKPLALKPDQKIIDVIEIRKKYGYKAVPITENGEHDGKLLGLITRNDYLEKHASQKISERMTSLEDLLIAEDGISLTSANKILEESKHSKLLIVNNKKDLLLRALVTRSDIEKNEMYPLSAKDSEKRLIVGAAVGPSKDMEKRVQCLVEAHADVIVIDTAHGHSEGVIEAVKRIKKLFPKIELIAGNVGTAEGAEALAKAGADTVKVGIGPGSICTTRVITGVGIPQFSAIKNSCAIKKKYNVKIIADGGIKFSGDLSKAIAAGADSVMIGSLFAGTDESPGEFVYSEGKSYKIYRGMGSIAAMAKGSKDRYGQGDVINREKLVPEGIEGKIIYKGPVSNEIFQLVGGLKSSLGYLGSKNIEEFQKKVRFIKITSSSLRESHPHDVNIFKEAPNYRTRR